MKNGIVSGFPKTAVEALKQFQSGLSVFVPNLGGLGPSYDQAIWLGIFKMIQRYHEEDMETWVLHKDGRQMFSVIVDEKLMAVDKELGLGLSGAMAGMVKYMAFKVMREGWREIIEKYDRERLIQVDRDFPGWKD